MMGTHTLFSKKTIALSIALAMTGCGGGGGGAAPAPGTTPPEDTSVKGVTFSGAAAKGIIKNGSVTAIEVNSNGTEIGPVGTATTAADGTYTIALTDDYQGGPIKVRVTKTANTEMKCDVPAGCGTRVDDITDDNTTIEFGEWYKPSALTLSAIVPPKAAGAEVKVNLTPFTHLAAEQALATGSVTAETVDKANSEVSALIGGINILNTPPMDITDPAAVADADSQQTTYAALASSIAGLAEKTDTGEPAIEAALEKLVESFSGGKMAADDSGSESDDQIISVREILDAANDTFTEIGQTDTSGVINEMETAVENADEDIDGDGIADINPEPSPDAGNPELEKVKALVTDIRTWGTIALDQHEARGQVFGDQIELASESLSLLQQYNPNANNFTTFSKIIYTYLFEGGSQDLTSYPLYLTPWAAEPTFLSSGEISTPEHGVVVISNVSFSNDQSDRFDMTFKFPHDGLTTDAISVQIVSAKTTTLYTESEIEVGAVTFNLATPYTMNWAAIEVGNASIPEITSLKVDFKGSFTQKLNTQATLDTYTPEAGFQYIYLAEPITIAGDFSALILVDATVNETTGEIENVWPVPSTIRISGSISNTKGDSVEGNFALNIKNASTLKPFTEEQGETADNWADIDLGVSFIGKLDGLPEASITLSGDRTDFREIDVDMTIAYGTRKLMFSATGRGDGESGELVDGIKITNQDGAVMTFIPNEATESGTLSLDGKTYGTIVETSSGLIKLEYIDNTFELLM